MEGLTKQQLILLALLVSFVTSIATGIATASLLEQAPPEVTRVINRVVERTVETVTPEQQAATVVTKEETIVVREDELITESISNARESLVTVENENSVVVGSGFVVSKDGHVATAAHSIEERGEYHVVLPDGARHRVAVVRKNDENDIALLSFQQVPDSGVKPLILGKTSELKLGSSVLVVGGSAERVAMGIISEFKRGALESDSDGVDGEDTIITTIHTNISQEALTPGVPLLNLFGEVIGIFTGTPEGRFLPVEQLVAERDAL